MSRRGSRRGFTLIELMIVVAILALILMSGSAALIRNQSAMQVKQIAINLESGVKSARAISRTLGPRMHDGTANFAYVNCTPPGANEPPVVVTINPNGTYEVPENITVAGANVTISCRNGDVTTESQGEGVLSDPANPTAPKPAQHRFAFAANGRPVVLNGTNDLVFTVFSNEAKRNVGFRVLPSGMTCKATLPAPNWCDEDA